MDHTSVDDAEATLVDDLPQLESKSPVAFLSSSYVNSLRQPYVNMVRNST